MELGRIDSGENKESLAKGDRMKTLVVLTLALLMSVSLANAQETDQLRQLQADQKLLQSTVERLQKLVEELKVKTVALEAENVRLRGLLEKAGIDPKKGEDVAVKPAEPVKEDKAVPVKTYASIAAILAEVPIEPPAKPREWNDLTQTLHKEWTEKVNQWLADNMQGKRLSTTATISNIGLNGNVLALSFAVRVGATSFKGVPFSTNEPGGVVKSYFTIELERNDDTVSQFAMLKTGDTCSLVADVGSLTSGEMWWDGRRLALAGVSLQIGNECTLGDFKQAVVTKDRPPTTVRIQRPEGGGKIYVGKVR